MPTATLNKKLVMGFLKKKVSEDELKDRISMIGTDLDGIEGDEISVEVFPNRPDLMSEAGMGRALNGFMGFETGLVKYDVINDGKYKATVDKSVLPVRRYTYCAVLRGLKLNHEKIVSLMQMQEKLHMTHSRNRKIASIGVHDMDAVKFPLTYTTVDEKFAFVPLDYTKKMTIKEILASHPKGKAYAHLVPGPRYPVWLDADGEVLSFPPIINAARTTVTEKTQNIFVDVTGLDAKATEQALDMIVCALADDGGKIYAVDIDGEIYPRLSGRKMELDYSYAKRLTGLDVSVSQMVELLSRMRFEASDIGNGKISVIVPAYRTDILHPIDLVEDVAIAYGYDKIDAEIPRISTVGHESAETVLSRKVAEVSTGLGMIECMNYHIAGFEHLTTFMKKKGAGIVKTSNAVNIDYNALRNALLPGMLKVVAENKQYEYPQRMFEVGRVIVADAKSDTNVREDLHLTCVLAGADAEYSDVRAMLEAVLYNLGVSFEVREADDESFIPGRCARVLVSGKDAGIMGEVDPLVLNNFEVEVPVAAFEIDLSGCL